MPGNFHEYLEVNVELCRAVYENKGFLPAVRRECVQDGKAVPDESVVGDRRVPCKTGALGVMGHDEVWTVWSADQKKRHEEFYESAKYAGLSKMWCLQCLCPGHLAPACRRYRTDKYQLNCSYCGDGTHSQEACPLSTNGVGCDQCGSELHGRLMCGYNEPLVGDATCSVRVAILAMYAKYLPQFHENDERHKAVLASRSELTGRSGRKHTRELMRVLSILGVEKGYY